MVVELPSMFLIVIIIAVNTQQIQSGDSIRPTNYSGYSLIDAIPNNEENVKFLRHLDSSVNDGCLDFWLEPGVTSKPVDILLHPEITSTIMKEFRGRNITVKLITNNVANSTDKEKDEISQRRKEFLSNCNKMKSGCVLDFMNYNDLQTIESYMLKLSKSPRNFSSLKNLEVKLSAIGTTYEKRDIRMVSLSLKDGKKKRAIWIDCGIHAREWISPAFCLYTIDSLIKSSRSFLNHVDFFIVPVSNPDGYAYSWTNNRFWRKNRRPNQLKVNSRSITGLVCMGNPSYWNEQLLDVIHRSPEDSLIPHFEHQSYGDYSLDHFSSLPSQIRETCKYGTDVNRNFDSDWASTCGRYCNDVCSQGYPGTEPFSEAESRAIRDAISSIKSRQEISAFVDIHSYSQMWLTPYGLEGKYSIHNKELKRVAKIATKALSNVHGTAYRYGTVFAIIGKNISGGSIDWAHEVKGQIKIITYFFNGIFWLCIVSFNNLL